MDVTGGWGTGVDRNYKMSVRSSQAASPLLDGLAYQMGLVCHYLREPGG